MKSFRLLSCLTALLLACASLNATDIRSIETEVYLHRNGNAVIGQTWDVTITGGTEWYIPIENMGQRSIRKFLVYENDRQYENEGRKWNSKRTLEQKKFRCGIAETGPESVELCWGQGEMGDHVYDIMYILDDLVQASSDGENDVFNWQFLNDEWSACPQRVSMTIYNYADSTQVWRAGEDGNMGVWVFGCEADCTVDSCGVVHIETTEPFRYDSHLTVMMRFDKGMFNPATKEARTFEQLRDDAFLDSDYYFLDDGYETEEKSLWYYLKELVIVLFQIAIGVLIPVVVLIIIPILLVLFWRKVTGRRYKKSVFGQKRITGFSHELPLGGNLYATYSLLAEGDKLASRDSLFVNMMGAYFLRWIHKGLVACEKDTEHEGRMNLRFTQSTPDGLNTSDELERKYYKAARLAAGDNLVLEADEFSKWSKANSSAVSGWPDEAKRAGARVWDPLPMETRRKVVEFKNFLSDFTLSEERGAPEIVLWQEYLVFAELFGMADKVTKNLEKLYPTVYQEYVSKAHLSGVNTHEVLRSVARSSASLLSAARSEQNRLAALNSSRSSSSSSSRSRSYGGGGHSSYHGGGGHSGGGHGGGSR